MSDSTVLTAPGAALLGWEQKAAVAVVAAFRAEESGSTAAATSDGAVEERVHRAARLFVAGEYPDKGCLVTEDDLDAIVARFYAGGASVPVKSEHTDSPLDPLGEVVGLYRRGAELFGMLCFSPGVHAHIEARGAGNLSVALTREPKEEGGGYRLTETSLVFRGRVPGAGFLSRSRWKQRSPRFARRATDASDGTACGAAAFPRRRRCSSAMVRRAMCAAKRWRCWRRCRSFSRAAVWAWGRFQ